MSLRRSYKLVIEKGCHWLLAFFGYVTFFSAPLLYPLWFLLVSVHALPFLFIESNFFSSPHKFFWSSVAESLFMCRFKVYPEVENRNSIPKPIICPSQVCFLSTCVDLWLKFMYLGPNLILIMQHKWNHEIFYLHLALKVSYISLFFFILLSYSTNSSLYLCFRWPGKPRILDSSCLSFHASNSFHFSWEYFLWIQFSLSPVTEL